MTDVDKKTKKENEKKRGGRRGSGRGRGEWGRLADSRKFLLHNSLNSKFYTSLQDPLLGKVSAQKGEQ